MNDSQRAIICWSCLAILSIFFYISVIWVSHQTHRGYTVQGLLAWIPLTFLFGIIAALVSGSIFTARDQSQRKTQQQSGLGVSGILAIIIPISSVILYFILYANFGNLSY